MNGAEILTRFTADTSQVDKATKTYTNDLGKLTTAFTLGNLAAQGVSKAIGVISQNMDSAIGRFDTMNNFPKVMKNLGISSDDANEAVNILSEKLKGLPTTLDQATMSVQRLTTKTGDVKESTDLFLALNNAIIAGGANATTQASALEQISQAIAKGKPDMMEWRSMLTAMPAQLTQAAKAMGYLDVSALGEAVREKGGEKEFTRLLETMKKLNVEGSGELGSFEEQARAATGGIAVSVTNMKTAFARGIAGMIEQVDDALKEFGGISGVLSIIGKTGEKAFKKLGSIIASVIPKIKSVVNFFKEHKVILGVLVGIIGAVVTALTTYKTIMTIINTIQAIQNALLLANPAVLIISAIVAAIAVLVAAVLWLWNNCEGFRNVVLGIFEAIKTAFNVIVEFIKSVIQNIMNIIMPIVEFVKNVFLLIVALITNYIDMVLGIVMPIVDFVWNNVLQPIFNFFSDIFGKIWDVIKKVIDKIKGAFEKIKQPIETVFTAIKDTISNIFKTIGEIVKTPINAIIDGINKVLKKINDIKIPDWVPGIGGQHTNFGMIPKLNVGTNYVPEDTLAVIHKGEAVVPKKFNPYANGVRTQTISNMNASTPTINVVVNADFKTDPLGQLVSNIKTFSGGAKNDYNYGVGR